MRSLNEHDVLINLSQFKRYCFYQLFDPNSKTIFNYNAYRIYNIVFIVIIQACIIYSAIGLYMKTDTVDDISILLILFNYFNTILSMLKISVFIYKSDQIWDFIDLTRLDFLTSVRCRDNDKILHERREKLIKVTNFIFILAIIVFAIWMLFPSVIEKKPNERRQNIFNMLYPVSVVEYNQYFYFFYLIEILMGVFILYYTTMIDIFIVSFCWVTIAQYEVLGRAFESIGYEDEVNNSWIKGEYNRENAYEDFKSILFDQSNIYGKLKSLYSVIWIIVLLSVILNSGSLIILSYLILVICMSTRSFSVMNIIKLIPGYLAILFMLFIYCYIIGNLNAKREQVKFSIYSCNWPIMSLKFKKLLLLTMRMNNSNQLVLKISPSKIIDSQFFSSVIITFIHKEQTKLTLSLNNNETLKTYENVCCQVMMNSYNIVSVMQKTLNKEN